MWLAASSWRAGGLGQAVGLRRVVFHLFLKLSFCVSGQVPPGAVTAVSVGFIMYHNNLLVNIFKPFFSICFALLFVVKSVSSN